MAQLQHDLVLNGKKISADIESAIIECSTTRDLSGEFSLKMTIADPHRELLNSALLTESSQITALGENFRLQQVRKDGDYIEVAFDHEPQWRLRQKKGPLHVARRKMNRVRFAQLMVAQTKGIDLFAPRKADVAPKPRGASGKPGDTAFSPNADITVKGKTATKEQIRNIEAVLKVGLDMKASVAVLISAIMTITVESSAINLTYGDRDSVGLFQQRPSQGWKGLRNIPLAAKEYFERAIPFTEQYFTSDNQKKPDENVPLWKISQHVQGSQFPRRYAEWQAEATNTVNQLNRPGWQVDISGGKDTYTFVRFKDENTWAALGRLADEVQWRRFMVGNTVWFVPDDWLYAGPPVIVVEEHENGIQDINFDYDVGKPVGSADFEVRTTEWSGQPGACIEIKNCGAASGKWLVKSLDFDFYTSYTTVNLIKPQPTLKEPARNPAEPQDGSSIGEEVVKWAEERIGVNLTGGDAGKPKYVYGAYHVGFDKFRATPDYRGPWDCSSFAAQAWAVCGNVDVGNNTTDQINTAKANGNVLKGVGKPPGGFQPGDLVFPNTHDHVAIAIDDKTQISASSPSRGVIKDDMYPASEIKFWCRWTPVAKGPHA